MPTTGAGLDRGAANVRRAATGRRTTLVAAAFALFAALGLGAAAPAWAHAELISSTPADGGSVDALPTTATLTFSEALDPSTTQIALSDAAGAVTALPPFTPDGTTVDQPLPAGLAAGVWTLAYRVVSEDGHPVGGAIHFTVTTAAAGGADNSGGADDAAGASTAPTTNGATSPNTPNTPATTAPNTVAAADTTDHSHTGWWIAGAVVVVALAGAATVAARRARARG